MNLLLALSLLAAGPLVGGESRIGLVRTPSALALASAKDTVLMAWNETGRIRARVGQTTVDLGNGSDVAIASNGSDFLIVWQEEQRVAGALWSDPTNVRTYIGSLAAFRKAPQVVWDGTAFHVFGGASAVDAAAAGNGTTITSTIRSEPEGYRCVFGGLSVTCGVLAAYYEVSWRVTGSPVFFLQRTVNQIGFTSGQAPGLAAGANDFLIAWKTPFSIEGRRLGPDAGVLGLLNIPLAHTTQGKRGPQIAWDGTRYLIVFDSYTTSYDIFGAVYVPGENFMAEPFVIAGSAEHESAPAVTSNGDGRFVVSYFVNNDQIGTRTVSFTEPPSRRRATR